MNRRGFFGMVAAAFAFLVAPFKAKTDTVKIGFAFDPKSGCCTYLIDGVKYGDEGFKGWVNYTESYQPHSTDQGKS